MQIFEALSQHNEIDIVTPQTQKGLKHEKYIPGVPLNFSFLANQTIGDLYFPFYSTE